MVRLARCSPFTPSARPPPRPAGRRGCCATSSSTASSTPRRTDAGYRLYGLAELNRLRTLKELRRRFGVELAELAFARRLRREPELRNAVDAWLAAGDDAGSWVEWEQRKHERLLTA